MACEKLWVPLFCLLLRDLTEKQGGLLVYVLEGRQERAVPLTPTWTSTGGPECGRKEEKARSVLELQGL